MTIQLTPKGTLALVAVLGVLTGLSISPLTEAVSGKSEKGAASTRSAAADRQIIRELKNLRAVRSELGTIKTELTTLNDRVGSSRFDEDSMTSLIYNVQKNTGYVCREISGSSLCTTVGG